MELLQVDRNVLLAPLQAVSGVVERRHTLPILSNVLLEIGAGKLSCNRYRFGNPGGL